MSVRFFAIVDYSNEIWDEDTGEKFGWNGHTIDYYPEEEKMYRREYRHRIMGDFATQEEAHARVTEILNRIIACAN